MRKPMCNQMLRVISAADRAEIWYSSDTRNSW